MAPTNTQSTQPTNVPVTGVTLDHTTLSVEAGKTAQLTATIAPADATDKTVTYASSDDTVATVANDGTVSGVKAGTVNITATIDGKTATSAVTVTAATTA